MRGDLERELKLDAGEIRLGELGGEPLETRIFTSTYHDTPDYRLAHLGITLRLRTEGEFAAWQLKLPRPGGRVELEAPAELPSLPAEVLDLLAAPLHGRSLAPVVTLRTERRGVRLVHDGTEADVVLDEVVVLDGPRAGTSFFELEAELQGEGDLEAVAEVLRAAGAADGDGRPKLLRVLGVDRTPARPASDQAGEHLRAMIGRQYDQILRHDPGARLGDDPEDLHDLRVAVRRLRALLRASRPLVVETWSEPLREELAWLGRALGPARDLDVMLDHIRSEIAALGDERDLGRPIVTALEVERDRARHAMLAELRTRRYLDLLGALERAARAPVLHTEQQPLPEIAAREFRRLRKTMAKIGPEPSDEALHRARIKGKRARYAAELAETIMGTPAERLISRAKRFQDVLGEHQDAIVAEAKIRELTADGPRDTALVAGRLIERERERRRAAREELPRAWKKLKRAGKKAFS
jgi:CHAD domain-containing protein